MEKPSIVIFGVGLIGGSLAIDLRNAGFCGKISGIGRSRTNLEEALNRGVIDEILSDPVEAARDADIIVLATPVTTVAELLETIAPAVDDDSLVTDVGSVKTGIVDAARAALGNQFSRFVPGHPIAGKEKSGISAATDSLFEGHNVILTPDPATDRDATNTIRRMWECTGACVTEMDVIDHDRVLSVTSHLPHVLAYVMMHFLANCSDSERCYEMAAGGFYDFTRTASSDPEMWRDISFMNSPRLLQHIEEYQQQLETVASMIRNGDVKGIENLYAEAKAARSMVSERRKLIS